jgi:hypothetical protein
MVSPIFSLTVLGRRYFSRLSERSLLSARAFTTMFIIPLAISTKAGSLAAGHMVVGRRERRSRYNMCSLWQLIATGPGR